MPVLPGQVVGVGECRSRGIGSPTERWCSIHAGNRFHRKRCSFTWTIP